jgi:hypothetical protein
MHHQAGRLAQAEEIYRRVLRVQPDHAGAPTIQILDLVN